MRKKDELIQLLFRLYNDHPWDDMEEYFAVAYSLLIYHGAKFRLLEDVIDGYKTDVWRSITGDLRVSQINEKHRVAFDEAVENSSKIRVLSKCEDSEEAWRELVNMTDSTEWFGRVCHELITFKNND